MNFTSVENFSHLIELSKYFDILNINKVQSERWMKQFFCKYFFSILLNIWSSSFKNTKKYFYFCFMKLMLNRNKHRWTYTRSLSFISFKELNKRLFLLLFLRHQSHFLIKNYKNAITFIFVRKSKFPDKLSVNDTSELFLISV